MAKYLVSCWIQKGYQYDRAGKHQFQYIPFYQLDSPIKQPAYRTRFVAVEEAMQMETYPKAHYYYYSYLCFGTHGCTSADTDVDVSLAVVASIVETAIKKTKHAN